MSLLRYKISTYVIEFTTVLNSEALMKGFTLVNITFYIKLPIKIRKINVFMYEELYCI
jgi:hypothetical protein